MKNKKGGHAMTANTLEGFRQNKYTNFEAEIQAIRQYLKDHNVTATMCAVALDIYRPNLCRHKATLEKAGLLIETHKAACKETGWPANYLTTNPELIKELKKGEKK